jgi:hypothetical protein
VSCCWFIQGLHALPFLCKVSKQLCLTPLPSVYQDLLWRSIREMCKVCGNVPLDAAFCLICGDLLCFKSKCSGHATEHGVCSTHAEEEYAGIGIFLLMRTTQVLLMRGNRVCTLPSIYLDQHGEEDYELRRNQKLYKSELRLNEVRRLWLTAGFDFNTHILHTSCISNGEFWYEHQDLHHLSTILSLTNGNMGIEPMVQTQFSPESPKPEVLLLVRSPGSACI